VQRQHGIVQCVRSRAAFRCWLSYTVGWIRAPYVWGHERILGAAGRGPSAGEAEAAMKTVLAIIGLVALIWFIAFLVAHSGQLPVFW